ncbi:SpoU_methylase-domain-containing protein, partial [Fragilariopsis cylindrus CCMP1102]
NNIITSSKSQTVKTIKALLTKRKKRNEFSQTVVEGPRMVFDLLENPKTRNLVRQVLVSAQNEHDFRDDYLSRLISSLDDNNENQEKKKEVPVQLVHPDVFNKDCTDTISPQGIVAIVDIPNNNDIDSNVAATTNTIGGTPMYLVLDGVSDPGNLGTLLRSSLACNVAGVVLLPDCCDVWNPKAVRSSMGASFQIPIIESPSWNDALSMLKSKGVQTVYAATMIENDDNDDDAPNSSVSYYDVNWTDGPSALVIGSEGNGLSTTVREDLTRKKKKTATEDIVVGATHIPMGAGIESLNAAVCGSVILFEYSRQ